MYRHPYTKLLPCQGAMVWLVQVLSVLLREHEASHTQTPLHWCVSDRLLAVMPLPLYDTCTHVEQRQVAPQASPFRARGWTIQSPGFRALALHVVHI